MKDKIIAEEIQPLEEERRKTEYTHLGGFLEEDEERPDSENSEEVSQKLMDYRYFDGSRIRRSVKISTDVNKEGEKLLKQGKIVLKDIYSGFDGWKSQRKGQLSATGYEGNRQFPIWIIFERTQVKELRCQCKKCTGDYYGMFDVSKTSCPYKAGALKLLEEYLQVHNIGDATDFGGHRLLNAFERRRANMVMADAEAKEESLLLTPRLTRKNGKLSLSFKIGEKKLFIIKKLDVFCENVRKSASDVYGSSTEINHDARNFTEEGRRWIRLISKIVREEKEFQQRLYSSRYYYGREKESVGGSLELFGWRLDELYESLGQESIEFEDKDAREKKKQVLTCADRNPKISIRISEDVIMGNKEFHGIKVEGRFPELYYGTDAAYFISDNHLNRAEADFLEKAEPLANIAAGDSFSFNVGRNRISEFYARILPELENIASITETQPEKFRSYVLPEAQFIFYLDTEEDDAVCRTYAIYGGKEYSVLEGARKAKAAKLEPFRDHNREEEIIYHVNSWFPIIDWDNDEMCCGKDETLIYRLMKEGTEKLMELGEVRCTKRFLGASKVNKVKVSVGVSLSSGLLDLNVSTEDVSAAELLDILKSYRKKKKYYRLKDGSFVDLDEPSLEMLAELSEAMNLKDKELLKGKMKLPMYRTLYLDKLLEEHDGVYSSRDSRFREIVKGFKTVKDADFEEPASLSRQMRKYQKDGYKWLRTLEAWQFGGILADDMGLGKTLQVIAVILAAKEEGKEGTALVVTPASLVYNWDAEFEKFAPQLKVCLVTGNQEERQKKIEAYKEADVLVTSYDLLKRDIALYDGKKFSYEIIDEAQYIKNHTTAAAKAVKIIESRIRYALTGTPIENRLSELWSIFDYLMPGFLYEYETFKREIETPIVKNNDEKALKRLQKMTGPFILRRLKEDVLKDLPEKLEEYRYVRLGSSQQKLYDGQVVHMKEQIARQNPEDFNKNKLQILAELTRLRQICCDPSLCFENYKGETAKLEACLELIRSAMDGGHRILVFSQFTSMLEILQEKLTGLKIPFFTITGSTSKEKRLELVKSFNEGTVPVFLISLKAGGVGLNLTGADVVIHYDPWWNLAAQNQATDRAHRIGQTKKVTVYKLIAKQTIEEKIQKLQESKKNLADQVINGERASLGNMSRDELLELLEV
ncbi:MAG: SNF2 helicase associated domain-containing protein [Blautia sp.]|nr:SNF2 helicase associated domain-containing protein [Blautia sp.]